MCKGMADIHGRGSVRVRAKRAGVHHVRRDSRNLTTVSGFSTAFKLMRTVDGAESVMVFLCTPWLAALSSPDQLMLCYVCAYV